MPDVVPRAIQIRAQSRPRLARRRARDSPLHTVEALLGFGEKGVEQRCQSSLLFRLGLYCQRLAVRSQAALVSFQIANLLHGLGQGPALLREALAREVVCVLVERLLERRQGSAQFRQRFGQGTRVALFQQRIESGRLFQRPLRIRHVHPVGRNLVARLDLADLARQLGNARAQLADLALDLPAQSFITRHLVARQQVLQALVRIGQFLAQLGQIVEALPADEIVEHEHGTL